MRCRYNRNNPPGVKGDMGSHKNLKLRLPELKMCDKQNYTKYHQYGYQMKGLIEMITKIYNLYVFI